MAADYGTRINKFKSDLAAWQTEQDRLQERFDFWTDVAEDYQRKRAEAVESGEEATEQNEGVPTDEQQDVRLQENEDANETTNEDITQTNEESDVTDERESGETDSDNEQNGEADKPSFLDAIKTIVTKGKDAASKLFKMKFFDVAQTPDFMKDLGITGEKFTIAYGVMSRHFDKDANHNLTESEWKQLPDAIKRPFAITKYFSDKEHKNQKGYRLYTIIPKGQGYVVVGVDVKRMNQGKGKTILEINSISTVFGKDGAITEFEEEIYRDKKITPEQQALLKKPNSSQYPTEQEQSSVGKDNKQISEKQEKEEDKNNDNAKSERKDKIEDVGERLEGARKDMLKVLSKSFEDATVQALIELPFSKVFKKPDLKKTVESGALREEDALFFEALFALMNTNKPRLTRSEAQRKKRYDGYETNVEKWAKQTHDTLSFLKEFVEATPEQRDIMMRAMTEDHFPSREKELADIEQRKDWNKDYTYVDSDGKEQKKKYEWGDKTTPNMVWVMHEILSRLGYEVGDKVDIPYGVIKASSDGLYYVLENDKAERNYAIGTFASIEDAIDAAVYLAKLKRGDTDLQHPQRLFNTKHTKTTYKDSGRYRVIYGANLTAKEFDSKEAADKFVKEKEARGVSAYASPIQEIDEMTDYVVTFYHPLTGEKIQMDGEKYATKAEARAYLSENMESVNEAVNAKVREKAGQKGQKKELTADDMMHVSYSYDVMNKTASYAVYVNKEVANNYGMPVMLREGFKTREEAKRWLEEHKAEIFDIYKQAEAKRKAYVYFSSGQDTRVGEDYRNGKDVTAEDFMNEFGFRGVQFGNWTNQHDRQMAVNQAFDALIDLARLLGVSPKALSLGGKLGMAFGSRGSGNANAHFERDEFVINLTKTRGAGSLAHEWWHALDSYFAKQAGMELGMVTEQASLEIRAELRKAYNDLVDTVKRSDYYERSRENGSYWSSIREVTARLFAEWVDRELKKRGELNTFLSRGANVERWQKMMYNIHKAAAMVAGNEPITFDEFKQTKESLKGLPYPSATEVDELGDAVRNIFETVQEREDETTGAVALFHKAVEEAMEVSEQDTMLRDALADIMRKAGIDVDMEHGQEVLDMANGEDGVRFMGSKVEKRKTHLADALGGREMTEQQRTVSDVYTGAADNLPLTVERDGKDMTIVMRQGKEENAGTKHSLYRHYGTTTGVITADDVMRIPDVLAKGERTEKMRGKTRLYEYTLKDADGTVFTVLTEMNNRSDEVFADFYSNRKASSIARQTHSEEAQADIDNALSAAKVSNNSESASNKKDNSVREHRVYHGSGADFDAFNHSHMGEGEDGASNYVIFNEADANITDKVRFFRTSDGEVYGFVKGGKIYLDSRIAGSETAIHEYIHLWTEAVRKNNPKLWNEIRNIFETDKEVAPFWDKVKKDYPELSGDELLEEVIAHYSGKQGSEKLNAAVNELTKENDGKLDADTINKAIDKVRTTLNRFWDAVKSIFNIKDRKAEDIADMVLRDLLNGVKPDAKGEANARFSKSTDLDRMYPNWNDTQTTSKGGHSTQITGTVSTYRKIGDMLVSKGMNNVSILDASSGKGVGTEALRDMGLNVDDVEPYAPNDRKNVPTYDSYNKIDKKYDVIISNAVLNVVPDDWRADVLRDMASHLADGGMMIINTRGVEDAKTVKNKVELDDETEILISNGKGGYRSYQKFFTHDTLSKFITDTLGDGYVVEKANKNNAGFANSNAVVVRKRNTLRGSTKKASTQNRVGASASDTAVSSEGVANVRQNLERTKKIYENLANRTRGFITDIAQALGLHPHEASKYGTFTTEDGKVFTLRISNHNASVANFDANGEREGISVVISKYGNRGVRNNGKAHVTEYFYPKRAIEQAEGKPLAAIIESIQDLLTTGIYTDKTGIARKEEVNISKDTPRYSELFGDESVTDSESTDTESMSEAVRTVADELHTPVTILTSESDLDASGLSERVRRKLKEDGNGLYIDGKVYVYLPNCRDAGEAARVVLHEVVGHLGLRELIGGEYYDTFLSELYRALPDSVRSVSISLVYVGLLAMTRCHPSCVLVHFYI